MSLPFVSRDRKPVSDLTDREALALAIQAEEEDSRVYRDIAAGLAGDFPSSAAVFREMAEEESQHRNRLLETFESRFGSHIPLIRREDVEGFARRKPIWLSPALDIDEVRQQAAAMEADAARFYRDAAARCADPALRRLFDDLADIESGHEATANRLESGVDAATRDDERASARRSFVLRIVQPALAGLMDGSVSTLAPVFAAAFATHDSWAAFLVGMAASIGAGISMGFAEALSDDGSLTGRGHPWMRGLVCGAATTLGGIGHTLPYLIPDFRVATLLAVAIVLAELWAIAYVRARFMDTPFLKAAFQVVLGGLLVFATGILIGSA